MNSKTLLAVYTIFAALSGVALTGSINSSTIAFADKPNDPDCFGDSASDLGGELGEHSRDGSDDVGIILTTAMEKRDVKVSEM